jgi:hypothetical protein
MKNEGRGVDLNTDFKRVCVRVTETLNKTNLLIKSIQPNEIYVDKATLIYLDQPTHKEGYINLHMHLVRPEDFNSTSVENSWVLEDTRIVNYNNSKLEYERFGHYKPVRINPDTMSGKWPKIEKFFATTDPECLESIDYMKIDFDSPMMHRIEYQIPKEFIKAYAESKGELVYAMVQPLYSSYPPFESGLEEWTSTDYKTDVDGFIAMFPALSYNNAMLKNQLY